jgi:hypothetical protein
MNHPVFLELLCTTFGSINVVLTLHGQTWSLCTCVELVLRLSFNGSISSLSFTHTQSPITQHREGLTANNERSKDFHCLEIHKFLVLSLASPSHGTANCPKISDLSITKTRTWATQRNSSKHSNAFKWITLKPATSRFCLLTAYCYFVAWFTLRS